MDSEYKDLYDTPIIQLGTEGYCDLAARILLEFYPSAEMYRITDSSNYSFRHVFLVIKGQIALDINGHSTIKEMIERYKSENTDKATVTTLKLVSDYFKNQSRDNEETRIITHRFREYIKNNTKIFKTN